MEFSNTSKSKCWMPNRRLHITAAGRDELFLALRLAFGDDGIHGYRCDRSNRGDALWLFSREGDQSLPVVAERGGQVSHFPQPLNCDEVCGLVQAFLRDGQAVSADCDGSVESGGFTLSTIGDRDAHSHRLVHIQPVYREFHK
jgi:hypothetical protein